MELLAFTVGLILTAFISLQMVVQGVRSFQRIGYERQAREHMDELWGSRLRAAFLRIRVIEESRQVWSGYRKFEVGRKQFENEAGTICSFYLYPHDRRRLPMFLPGQYLGIEFEVPDPNDPGETTQEHRCYSLSDSPKTNCFRITVRRVSAPPGSSDDIPPGLVSNYLHDHVEEGDLVDIMAPSGDFYLDVHKVTPLCLIAGGVGITPILSMVKSLAVLNSNREVWFFFGVRTRQEMVMQEEIEQLFPSLKNLRTFIYYSDEEGDIPQSDHQQIEYRSGRTDCETLRSNLPHNNYEYYFCGPGPMMSALHEGLSAWGVPDKDIHYELFAPPETGAPTAEAGVGQQYDVTFALSEKVLTWTTEKSLCELQRAKRFKCKKIKYACKQGKCGSCMTVIKRGSVEYPGTQPSFSGLVKGSCLPCICTPSSDLELEV